MTFEGAVIKEQQVTFAVVVVKRHIVDNPTEAARTIASFQPVFPRMPVVLAAQDAFGRLQYFGRKDIAQFLASVPANAIPWRKYEFN